MRLLNTKTCTLREFFGENIPPYAIFSHRWEEEEVTFRDLNEGRKRILKGYSKILGLCIQAEKDSLNWAWIDTCCIDKSSSAELTEAINSMFKWYRNAYVCYAYLSDVSSGMGEVHETKETTPLTPVSGSNEAGPCRNFLPPRRSNSTILRGNS